jgi:hypothetical protein
MNRSFMGVILGGVGATTGPVMAIAGEQISIDADGVAAALEEADSTVIVLGYGMVEAQAQQSVSELTRHLRAQGQAGALCHCSSRKEGRGPATLALRTLYSARRTPACSTEMPKPALINSCRLSEVHL